MADYEDEHEDENAWDVPPEPGRFDIGLEGRLWTVDHRYSLSDVLPEPVGLAKAVTLAPKELWVQALEQLEE